MRKLLASLVFAGTFVIVPGASAQQHNATTNTTQQPHTSLRAAENAAPPRNPFPIPAARYHLIISKRLQVLRAMHPVGPITQGDINKAILLMSDCASNVEADGIVTQAEMQHCNAVITALKRERTREVMATSTPEDWVRWERQLPVTHH